jgi:hypothetical protein
VVDKVLNLLKNMDNTKIGYLQKVFTEMVKRTKLTLEYDDSHLKTQIGSQITLIRSKEFDETDIDEAYGLNKYAKNEVTVKYTNGTHETMFDTYVDDLAEILNEYVLQIKN